MSRKRRRKAERKEHMLARSGKAGRWDRHRFDYRERAAGAHLEDHNDEIAEQRARAKKEGRT